MPEAVDRWRWPMKIPIYRNRDGAFGGGSVLSASGSYQVVDSASDEHILTGRRHLLDENDSSTGTGRWRASARRSGRRRSTARWCRWANLRKLTFNFLNFNFLNFKFECSRIFPRNYGHLATTWCTTFNNFEIWKRLRPDNITYWSIQVQQWASCQNCNRRKWPKWAPRSCRF